MMNTNISKQRFWHCCENGLIKAIQMMPHNLYVSVKFPLLRIKAYPNPQQREDDLTLTYRLWGIVWIVLMSPFSQQCQNLCLLSLAFIIDWRVVTGFFTWTEEVWLWILFLLDPILTWITSYLEEPCLEPGEGAAYPEVELLPGVDALWLVLIGLAQRLHSRPDVLVSDGRELGPENVLVLTASLARARLVAETQGIHHLETNVLPFFVAIQPKDQVICRKNILWASSKL